MSVFIKKMITPVDKTLRTVFMNPKSYFIDIYHREYKWKEENVRTLLNDLEVRFNLHERTKNKPKEIQTNVEKYFEPYFLYMYLTSSTSDNTSLVDGQQR